MKSKNLTLRPYLANIETYCQQLDHPSLIRLVLGLAQQVESKNRQGYLDTLLTLVTDDNKSNKGRPNSDIQIFLRNILSLKKNVLARMESIEDGSYWDDPDETDWEEYYYDDEDPELLSSDHVDDLSDHLSEAEQLFASGDKKGARVVYQALFALIDEVSEFGYLPEVHVDLCEARARYIRCVYDLEQPSKRAATLWAVLYPGSAQSDFNGILPAQLPLLQDVIDIELDAPKGLDDFLSQWMELLSVCDFRENRIADLLLEATMLTKGVEAVGRLAMDWGKKQPKGCLFWLDLLLEQQQWKELKDSARRVIKKLPAGSNRYKASGSLIKAGKHLDDADAVLEGYRERFHSLPEYANLVELVAEAGRQHKRSEEMESALNFCSVTKTEYVERDLTLCLLIMSGRFKEAFNQMKGGKSIGWSNSWMGLVYFSTLSLLTKGDKECALIDEGLRYYAAAGDVFSCSFEDRVDVTEDSYREIVTGLENVKLTKSEHTQYQSWCQDIAEKRVSHIVSNKYRGAYDRAAMVLAALAESKIKFNDLQGASALLHSYCRVKFSRFTAFRGEMRVAVGRSPLMLGWGKEL